MKKLFFLPVLLLSFSLMAQPPKIEAEKGMTFGEVVSADAAVMTSELPVLLADREKADVKVQGKVTEVCKAEGCWLRMETPTGNMLIKMKDHKFLVPLSLNGKTIVAEGSASMKETSVEMLRHYAEDAGKTKAEIDAITEPKREVVMQAKGILVL